MNYIWAGMLLISVIFGAVTGRIEAVGNSLFSGTGEAIELFTTLLGMLVLWSGIMRIADKAGLAKGFSRFTAPLTRLLFPGLRSEKAKAAISMNVAANLLGLGNAATPLGLEAMKEMQRDNPKKEQATRHMITFVVLNTSSVQLIPTTIATLRAKYGSAAPMEVMGPILFVSVAALVMGLIVCELMQKARDGYDWLRR